MTHYLLLMRHARHEALDAAHPEQRKLSTAGENETRGVSERLAEVLDESQDGGDLRLNIVQTWHAGTDETVKTANMVSGILAARAGEPVAIADLNPAVFNHHKEARARRSVADAFRTWTSRTGGDKGILVIGHQPFLSCLANDLTGFAVPLVHSEIACLAFDNADRGGKAKGRLLWVLSPSSGAASEDLKDLKEKIKSKMEIAKLLGAAITAVLAFLLGYLVDEEKLAGLRWYWGAELAVRLSTVAFLIAIALYLATMYAYDRLLMPTRFWGQTRLPGDPDQQPSWLVWRPPSSALWVLYQNMMRIWRYLFTGATYAVFMGMLLLTYAVFHPNHWYTISLFWAATAVGGWVFLLCYRHFGPRLGTED